MFPLRHRSFAFLAVLVVASTLVWSARATAVEVDRAWVRATVPGQMASGAYMGIASDKPVRIVGVETPAASLAQIHEMSMKGNTMSMRAVDALEVPAGKRVELKPGAFHVMLMDLKQPLKKGERIPLVLRIEGPDRKTVEQTVSLEVRDSAPEPAKR